MLKILHRRTGTKEFRVGHNANFRLGPGFPQDALDLVTGSERHCRLHDDNCIILQMRRSGSGHRIDRREVGPATDIARGCADSEEQRIRAGDACGKVGGKGQPLRLNVRADQRFEPRLVDRNGSIRQRGNLLAIVVDANDRMPDVGKAGSRYEPHVTCSDDT